MGYIPLTAMSGQEAIERFTSESPDLVLMDIMMPDMDGYEATAKIKALNPGKWTPIVFLSALEQEDSVVKGLDVGGDDYLTKPVRFLTLQAKINAMQRIAKLQRQIREKSEELEQYYFEAEEEKQISGHLMQHMINADGLRDPMLRYWISPAEHYSGDLVAAARSPAGVLYVLLADGTGHGLAAAINVLPLPQIFYSMVEKGFPAATVANEMNRKIRDFLPDDRFIATTLASVDTRNRIVEVWNGGNPTALFVADDGAIVHGFESRHLPLGIMDSGEFDSTTEFFHYEQPGQLLLCSDGLVETENETGEPFGWHRLLATLQDARGNDRFETLRKAMNTHLAGRGAGDDISLMLVDLPDDGKDIIAFPIKNAADGADKPSRWKMAMSFGGDELRYLDVVPHLMSFIEKIEALKPHLSPLFLIVSELYCNALDHGLLGLDSRLKSLDDGFDRYWAERERRLAELDDGSISLEFEQVAIDNKRLLKLCVKDSGAGFDTSAIPGDISDNADLFGRGIALVKSLSVSMEYLGCGNQVVVYYRL